MQPRNDPPTVPLVIHYTLEGRAEKMVILSNGLLLLHKLRENMEPLTYIDTNATKQRREKKVFASPCLVAAVCVCQRGHLWLQAITFLDCKKRAMFRYMML